MEVERVWFRSFRWFAQVRAFSIAVYPPIGLAAAIVQVLLGIHFVLAELGAGSPTV